MLQKLWCILYWINVETVKHKDFRITASIGILLQSVITEHRLQFNHDVDWEDVKILDSERFLGKRLVSEMMFIKKQKNDINLQSDTEHLDDAYFDFK